uniref:Uncharacterized protein n=1 Tax=Nelumbo nucifera TaxID=4432 RepID=A0A822YCC6_NELNU|nr:TPA_asm: hypothetical protein HUJ06_031241 [Nelumbo nucifera]
MRPVSMADHDADRTALRCWGQTLVSDGSLLPPLLLIKVLIFSDLYSLAQLVKSICEFITDLQGDWIRSIESTEIAAIAKSR